MSTPENNFRVDYVEFPVHSIPNTKSFYTAALGWQFEDYGPDYTCFHDGRLGGGFFTAKDGQVVTGGPLIVIYATDIDAVKERIVAAGGKIVKDTFEFPGGRRFHFTDPSGNELAIWTNT